MCLAVYLVYQQNVKPNRVLHFQKFIIAIYTILTTWSHTCKTRGYRVY